MFNLRRSLTFEIFFIQELEKKEKFWQEKMENDVDAKQHELTVLKAANQKDFQRLQDLTKLVIIYL